MFETQNTKDIEDQILYRDGSCRDINIDDVDLKSASKIINCFYQIYANQRCTNDRGDCLSVSIQNRAIELELSNYPNSLHFVFEDEEKLIKNLQIFMCSDKSKKVFVEVTFFPEDVSCEFTLESFKKFMAAKSKQGLGVGMPEFNGGIGAGRGEGFAVRTPGRAVGSGVVAFEGG